MRGFEFARKIQSDEKGVHICCNPDKPCEPLKAYEEAQIPEYQTKNSAGADFFCAEKVRIPSIWHGVMDVLVAKGESIFVKLFPNVDESEEVRKRESKRFQPTLVHTGIKACMHEDEVLLLYNRSSNPKKLGLILANSVGVVDSDYYNNPDNDGEIMFAYYNLFPFTVTLKVGDRIGQGVFQKYLRPNVNLRVKDAERMSGFGSTGK